MMPCVSLAVSFNGEKFYVTRIINSFLANNIHHMYYYYSNHDWILGGNYEKYGD